MTKFVGYKKIAAVYKILQQWVDEFPKELWDEEPKSIHYECKSCKAQQSFIKTAPGMIPGAMDCKNPNCGDLLRFKDADNKEIETDLEFYRPTLKELQKKREKIRDLDWAFTQQGLSIRKIKK